MDQRVSESYALAWRTAIGSSQQIARGGEQLLPVLLLVTRSAQVVPVGWAVEERFYEGVDKVREILRERDAVGLVAVSETTMGRVDASGVPEAMGGDGILIVGWLADGVQEEPEVRAWVLDWKRQAREITDVMIPPRLTGWVKDVFEV